MAPASILFCKVLFPYRTGSSIVEASGNSAGTLSTVSLKVATPPFQTWSLKIMSTAMLINTNFSNTDLTDTLEDTVVRAQAGDRDAFGDLVEQLHSRVYGIVMQRLRNTAEADEVVQEVFLRAYRKLSQLKEPAAFAGWLCQIAARLSINRAVRRPPETACEPASFEVMQQTPETSSTELIQMEDAEQLRSGLNRLGDLDRKTLIAFYFDGQSLKEMSVEFDSPIGTIKRRLHTARHRLRDVLTGFIG